MECIKIGDIVARKSYDSDIFFKVAKIEQIDGEKIFILKGISYRLQADSYEEDLILVDEGNKAEYQCKEEYKISKRHRI